MTVLKSIFRLMTVLLIFGALACATATTGGQDNPNPNDPNNPSNPNDPNNPVVDATVVFTPVGQELAFGLIDLEFFPDQSGHSLAITKDGTVYYLDENFSVVGTPYVIPTVQDGTERGLLNVAADPDYGNNRLVYFYYTDPDDNPDRNLVERYKVADNIVGNPNWLSDPQLIIEFQKVVDYSISQGRHNGGALVFMTQDELAIGVGDGATQDAAMELETPRSYLGKIHRIIPKRTAGMGGYTTPNNSEYNSSDPFSALHPSIYSRGLRNPFTIVVDKDGDLFVGDVGAASYEEINCVYYSGETYWWPICEGPCNDDPVNPIHGYAHNDTGFDPDFTFGGKAIFLSAIYQGSQYDGLFNDKIIYNDFYDGFVRLLTMNIYEQVLADQHIGNQPGLTGLHENPADGMLYGVSLFDNNRILRMDLAP